MSVARRGARPRGAEAGFTLVELLVALSVGTILMLAVFATLDFGARSSDEAQARSLATQRANALVDRVERVFNAVVCRPDGGPAFEAATTTSIVVHVNTTDGLARPASDDPQRRPPPPRRVRITYDASNARVLYEEVQGAYTGTTSTVTFPALPSTPVVPSASNPSPAVPAEVLATDVRRLTVDGVEQPVFAYRGYTYDSTSADAAALITQSGADVPLVPSGTTSLNEVSRARIATVLLRLSVRPDSVTADRRPGDVPLVRSFSNGAIDTADSRGLPGCA